MIEEAAGVPDEQSASTRTRILRAAERLFATHGIDGVSLRRINTEAGTNVASTNYHFGTKDDVVRAILADRMPGIEQRRRQMLDAIDPGHPSVESVVRALVVPLAALAQSGPDGRAYVRFLGRVRLHGDPEITRLVTNELAPSTRKVSRLLDTALPGVPRDLLRVRLLLVADLIVHALGEPERYAARSRRSFVETVITVASAALSAPVELHR